MISKDLVEQLVKMEDVLALQNILIKVQVGSRFYDLEDIVVLNVEERALVLKVRKKTKNV